MKNGHLPKKDIIIYVGTRKLVALIGDIRDGDPHVTGHATLANPDGFRRGLVTNLERAAYSLESLLDSLSQSKENPNEKIDIEGSVSVVVGNSRLKTYSFSSSKYFSNLRKTVSSQDVRSVVDQTRSVATLPLSEVILQSMPVSFVVNDLEDVSNPIGLEAQRLGVSMKMFTMEFQEFKNISRAFNAADIEVQGFYPKMLTVSQSVLTDDEKNDGVLLVDIAADATYLSLWKNRELIQTRVLDLGGHLLSEAIAQKWQIDSLDADKIKEQYGSLDKSLQFGDELVPLTASNGKKGHPINRHSFHESFLELGKNWLQQILSETERFLRDERMFHPHHVFTGGATGLDGFLEFLHSEFELDGRMGRARQIDAPSELLINPSNVAALGLFNWLSSQSNQNSRLYEPHGAFQRSFAVARDWFTSNF